MSDQESRTFDFAKFRKSIREFKILKTNFNQLKIKFDQSSSRSVSPKHMQEHRNDSQLNSSDNSDEPNRSKSDEAKWLQMKHKRITLYIVAWKYFDHIVQLWDDDDVIKEIWDNITMDSNNTEENKQIASELMPMADRVKKLADRVKKLADLELEEVVNKSIHQLISEIDESTIQYELSEKLIFEESLSLWGKWWKKSWYYIIVSFKFKFIHLI